MNDIRSEDLSASAQKRQEELSKRCEMAAGVQPAEEDGIRWIVNLQCVKLGPFTSVLLIWVPNSGNSI